MQPRSNTIATLTVRLQFAEIVCNDAAASVSSRWYLDLPCHACHVAVDVLPGYIAPAAADVHMAFTRFTTGPGLEAFDIQVHLAYHNNVGSDLEATGNPMTRETRNKTVD
jgi:hypothetical protein